MPDVAGGALWKHNQGEDTTVVDFDRWSRARAWRVVWPEGRGEPGEIPNHGIDWAMLSLARRRQGATVTALFADGTTQAAPTITLEAPSAKP